MKTFRTPKVEIVIVLCAGNMPLKKQFFSHNLVNPGRFSGSPRQGGMIFFDPKPLQKAFLIHFRKRILQGRSVEKYFEI